MIEDNFITSPPKIKQLLKKIQNIQCACMDIEGVYCEVTITTQERGLLKRLRHTEYSINVDFAPFSEETNFCFYSFYSVDENNKILSKLRNFVKKLKYNTLCQ